MRGGDGGGISSSCMSIILRHHGTSWGGMFGLDRLISCGNGTLDLNPHACGSTGPHGIETWHLSMTQAFQHTCTGIALKMLLLPPSLPFLSLPSLFSLTLPPPLSAMPTSLLHSFPDPPHPMDKRHSPSAFSASSVSLYTCSRCLHCLCVCCHRGCLPACLVCHIHVLFTSYAMAGKKKREKKEEDILPGLLATLLLLPSFLSQLYIYHNVCVYVTYIICVGSMPCIPFLFSLCGMTEEENDMTDSSFHFCCAFYCFWEGGWRLFNNSKPLGDIVVCDMLDRHDRQAGSGNGDMGMCSVCGMHGWFAETWNIVVWRVDLLPAY